MSEVTQVEEVSTTPTKRAKKTPVAPTEAKVSKGRGRPKGSKNKPKQVLVVES